MIEGVDEETQEFCRRLVDDQKLQDGFAALMAHLERRVFLEWRAGAFEDWSAAWGELDAVKRLQFAVITIGKVSNGKRESDNPRGKRRAAATSGGDNLKGAGAGNSGG